MAPAKKMRFLIIAIISIFGTVVASAHEAGEHGSAAGAFGLKAEYIHVLLNPLPVYGLAIALLALLGAWLARSRRAEGIALIFVIVCGALAWPTLYFGQHGYDHLFEQLDANSQQWLDLHMERAERFVYPFYATAGLGIAALICLKKLPKTARTLASITFLAGLLSLGIGAWISRAGGQVRHSEFRMNAPAQHEHDKDSEPSHEQSSPSGSEDAGTGH